ncbi:hypothetical protein OAG52_05365 [Verrucomicrobia bacterium]|nr:hypothetical protein [Verrucomicrobiota bacterium]
MNTKYPSMPTLDQQTIEHETPESWGQLIMGTLLTLGSLILVWAAI